MTEAVTAKDKKLAQCSVCDYLIPWQGEQYEHRCTRCHSKVVQRKTNSIQRCWAWTITSLIAFIPANTYPIMTILYFGKGEPDTILSGIMLLLKFGMYPIAFVVFFASFVVPLAKIVGLFYLLYAFERRSELNAKQKTKLYRYIEFFGRWSMLDVFVVALLVALVELGALVEITAGPGATAFGIMVLITMFAAHSLDPKLLWDKEKSNESK